MTVHRCILVLVTVWIQGIVSVDYSRGHNASLACNPRPGDTVRLVAWYYEYTGGDEADQTKVATWTDGGSPSDSGQWKGRTQLDTSTGDVLIKNLRLTDDGPYTCRYDVVPISMPGRTGATHEVTVVVPAGKPSMSGLPDADDDDVDWVKVDEPYTLICIVEEAKPAVNVQWIINGNPQQTDNQEEGVGTEGLKKTTGTLSGYKFSKTPARQKVTCRVKGNDDDYDYKTVDVYYKPSASIKDPGDKPLEGSDFVLTCDVLDGRPDPGENDFTWWRDNGELPIEKRKTLTLTLNHEEHDGEYECSASNKAGQGSRSAKHPLQVYYLASVLLSEFSSNPVVEGYDTSAACSVDDGHPLVVKGVAWKKGGGDVDEDGGRIELGESITITAVEKEDAGAYMCVITTDASSLSSQSQDLLVHYSPRGLPVLAVDKNPVAVDEEVTFTCGADDIDALPKVDTSAFFKGADSLANETSATWSSSFSTVTASGEYSCVRANVVAASQSSDAYTLQVLAEPGAPAAGVIVGAVIGGMLLGAVTATVITIVIMKRRTAGGSPASKQPPVYMNGEFVAEASAPPAAATDPSVYYNMQHVHHSPYEELNPASEAEADEAPHVYDRVTPTDSHSK